MCVRSIYRVNCHISYGYNNGWYGGGNWVKVGFNALIRSKICRACNDTVTNDPDYVWIIGKNFILSRFENIES